MAEIKLSNSDQVAIVDDILFPALKNITWRLNKDGYADAMLNGKRQLMHRLINETPEGMFTDHINHNRLDNRRENLRSCTASQNRANTPNNKGGNPGTSKYRGVCWAARHYKKGKASGWRWKAQISIDGKAKKIGYFHDEIEAAKAYDKAAKEQYGEFAILNFP